MVSKNLRRPSTLAPGWSRQVFRIHSVCFVNINSSWNGLGKSFEAIQNLMLIYKLMRIHIVCLLNSRVYKIAPDMKVQ